MKNILCAVILIFAAVGVTLAQSRDERIKTEVRKVLDEQTAAWNRGDIEGFMQGYWKSENLIFVSGDRVTRGWQQTTDNYKKNLQHARKNGRADVFRSGNRNFKQNGGESSRTLARGARTEGRSGALYADFPQIQRRLENNP